MIVSINRDLPADLVGYAESRAEDLLEISIRDAALDCAEDVHAAQKARRTVELARRILERR